MAIIRVQKKRNYSAIDNTVIEDARLSWGARGILIYLLSKPDSWTVSVAHLVKQSPQGRDFVYARIGELQELGYMEPTQDRSAVGRFAGTNWIVHEVPKSETPRAAGHRSSETKENTGAAPGASAGNPPYTDLPDTVHPDTVNPPVVNTEKYQEEEDVPARGETTRFTNSVIEIATDTLVLKGHQRQKVERLIREYVPTASKSAGKENPTGYLVAVVEDRLAKEPVDIDELFDAFDARHSPTPRRGGDQPIDTTPQVPIAAKGAEHG